MPRTKPRITRGSHAAFAKALAALVANAETEDAEATASLAGDILFDMSNEVGINVDHPALVRGYVLAALARLENKDPDDPLRERKHAEEMLGHLRELVDGCTDARFDEIYKLYNPDHEAERAAYYAKQPKLVELIAGYDIPADSIQTNDTIIAQRGSVPNGTLGVAKIGDEYILSRVYLIDPANVRLGETEDDIYPATDVEVIGPVIEIRRKLGTATLGEDEWPDVIGEGNPDA